jgi:hypothetical protein
MPLGLSDQSSLLKKNRYSIDWVGFISALIKLDIELGFVPPSA